jgi:hypothetical protein
LSATRERRHNTQIAGEPKVKLEALKTGTASGENWKGIFGKIFLRSMNDD